MDLEGFARRRIFEGAEKEDVIKGLAELVVEFKDWEAERRYDFSDAIYEEVKTSLQFKEIDDPLLRRVLGYPRTGVTMGEFGVGSRGVGDFKVHRDIAEIIGTSGAVIGPGEQDDAGVVKGGGRYVMVAVDGIHSRLSEFPFLAGFHAARAALRDVYVMGAMPVAILSDLHLADDGDVGKLFDYTAGVSAISDSTDVPLVSGSTLRVGGDMVFGDRLVAAVGAVGVSDSRPMARRLAEPGDAILITLGRGGGTISTTAIFSGSFEVVKETLNVDFSRSMDAVFKSGLHEYVNSMTDVTNGGLRGDAFEISKTSGTRLVFSESELRKTVPKPMLDMLDLLDIDYLGVSTDSLMLVLPKENVEKVKSVLERVTPVFEAGFVEKGEGAAIITEDGSKEELKPLFRESAYTKVKKVVGESSPVDLERMSKALDSAKREAIKKKNEVRKWLTID
jgi:hydrogenase expression/formation protein